MKQIALLLAEDLLLLRKGACPMLDLEADLEVVG
jgi:hypothetical protein